MLLPRFLTALVGIPLLLAAIWWGQVPFFVLMFGVSMLALYEYLTLAEEATWPVFKTLGMILGAALFISVFLFGTKMDWSGARDGRGFFVAGVVSILLAALLIFALLSRRKENAFISVAITWFGVFYTVWTTAHVLLIRELRPDGRGSAFFLFFVIWALDVGAYFGGMKFGKNRLLEDVSPKKTWEGVLFGTLAALLCALICRQIFLRSLSAGQSLWLGLTIAVLAQLSDLSESLFKRNTGVKDSGTLLPGHGGILDRFDSFLIAAPVFYYILVLFIIK